MIPTPQTAKIPSIQRSQFEVSNPYHSQGMAAGGSALLDAINRGQVHLAKFILDAGDNDVVNTRDFKGKTPLIRACYIKEEKTRKKAVELLLSKSCDVNIQDDVGRTCLSYACEVRANDVVKALVKNNVNPDIPDNKGNTPLIYSAIVGNDMAIEILIKSFRRLGLNVDHVNNDGLTALLIAAKNGFIECASILAMDGRACISFRDKEKGMNAEEWARMRGCTTPEVVPFSSNAAVWNYKYSKYYSFRGSEDEEDACDESTTSDKEVEKTMDRKSFREWLDKKEGDALVEIGEGLALTDSKHDKTAFPPHLNLNRVTLTDRFMNKRGSLPAMKFFTSSAKDVQHQTRQDGCELPVISGEVNRNDLTSNRDKNAHSWRGKKEDSIQEDTSNHTEREQIRSSPNFASSDLNGKRANPKLFLGQYGESQPNGKTVITSVSTKGINSINPKIKDNESLPLKAIQTNQTSSSRCTMAGQTSPPSTKALLKSVKIEKISTTSLKANVSAALEEDNLSPTSPISDTHADDDGLPCSRRSSTLASASKIDFDIHPGNSNSSPLRQTSLPHTRPMSTEEDLKQI